MQEYLPPSSFSSPFNNIIIHNFVSLFHYTLIFDFSPQNILESSKTNRRNRMEIDEISADGEADGEGRNGRLFGIHRIHWWIV